MEPANKAATEQLSGISQSSQVQGLGATLVGGQDARAKAALTGGALVPVSRNHEAAVLPGGRGTPFRLDQAESEAQTQSI